LSNNKKFLHILQSDFSWSIKADNETVEVLDSGDKKSFLEKSFYVLQADYAISRTYRCVANNTIGSGTFCEIEVAGTYILCYSLVCNTILLNNINIL